MNGGPTMRFWKTFASVLLLLVLPLMPAAAQEDDPDTMTEESDRAVEAGETEVTVEVGYWDADTEDNPALAAEYEPDDGGPSLGLLIRSSQPWGHFFLDAEYFEEDDQDATLSFDVHRMIRSTTEWTKLPHRLIHDPLSTFAAVTNHGRIVQHTDLDPDAVYGISYELLEHRTELQLPSLPGLTFAAGVRNQERHGTEQSVTISHCSTCHLVSQSRPIDEQDTGLTLEAKYAGDWGAVRGSVTQRELIQDPNFLTLLYDPELQPELRLPLFENRVSFDDDEGPLPVQLRPDIDKEVAQLDLLLSDVGGFALTAGGVWQETENQYTNLAMDYDGYVATAFRPLGTAWDVRWRGRSYAIENDPVFVDVDEQVAVAGPQVGRTWTEVYQYPVDFLRLSAANRDVLESRLDVGWDLGSREAGRLVFSWDHEQVDREHFEVAPDETETTENVLGVAWRARPARGWKVDARYRHGEVDNPFLALNSQYSTNFGVPAPNPFHPDADQYFVFQDARIGDGTAMPESWDEARLGITRTFSKSMLTASYRWWEGDNDSGDLTDWEKTNQSATITLWTAPAERWDWFVGYAWYDTEIGAPVSIPIFDG